MGLEEKINEGMDIFFSRIRKSVVGKIAAYGLAASLNLGGIAYSIGCGDGGGNSGGNGGECTTDYDCKGDRICTDGKCVEPNGQCACIDGEIQSCYSGTAGTEGIGICKAGTQTCTDETWGACEGEVTPQTEVCDGLDRNCNGIIPTDPGTVVDSFPSPDTAPAGLAWDSSFAYLWCVGAGTDTIYKLNTSGTVLDSFSSPSTEPAGLAWDGTYLWHADQNTDTIYKLNTSGAVVDSFSSPDVWPRGLAWDGTYLWHSDANTDIIYKLTTSGAVVDSFPSPGGDYPIGLAWDGTYLWNAKYTTDTIYKLNTSGVVVDSFPSPGSNPYGLTWDGTYLWNGDTDTDTIYKLTTECMDVPP